MNEPIRVVLVGAGVVAEKKHLPALRPLSEFQIVALADMVLGDGSRGPH